MDLIGYNPKLSAILMGLAVALFVIGVAPEWNWLRKNVKKHERKGRAKPRDTAEPFPDGTAFPSRITTLWLVRSKRCSFITAIAIGFA